MNPPGVAGAETRKHGGEPLTVAQPFLIPTAVGRLYRRAARGVGGAGAATDAPAAEHAAEEYLNGFEQIGLREDTIPNLADVNRRLGPRTGWNATPVSGFLPPDAFFEMLGQGSFRPRPTSGAARRWNTRRNRTFFTTCLGTCRCTRIPFLRISCSTTVG